MRRVTILDIAVFFIVVASLCVNSIVPIARTAGYLLIIVATSLLVIFIVSQRAVLIDKSIGYLLLPITAVYLLGFLRNMSFIALKDLVLLIITFLLVVIISNNADRIICTQRRIFYFFIPFFVFISAISFTMESSFNATDNGFKSIYTTTTFLGIFCVLFTEICFLNWRYTKSRMWMVYIAFMAVLIYLTKVRTAYIGFLLVCIGYLLSSNEKFFVSRKRFILRIGTYALIIGFIVIYPLLQQFRFFDFLSNFAYNYTGKILMTGRQTIWAYAFEKIKGSPVFGYGLDLSNVLVIELSQVHNSFLNIILQVGGLGFAMIALAINRILKIIEGGGTTHSSAIIEVFTLVNLIMCLTEVMLLQGQIILQILIWSIMAIGLGKSIHVDKFDQNIL